MEAPPVPHVESRFSTHEFSRKFGDNSVHFIVLKMKDSFFLWVGSRKADLVNLSIAMATGYERNPTSASLLGDASDLSSSSLASKLSQRTGCQVFASCNLPNADKTMMNFVHECIVEEMTLFPDKFHEERGSEAK